uniref:Uncharacterized protein n=1 Tax=Strix occidentalis caurina TaxID=311401 RepID=A0A8D0F5R7_STROC
MRQETSSCRYCPFKKYYEAKVKVREATSNNSWRPPPSSLM